jgi:hypothetical protein
MPQYRHHTLHVISVYVVEVFTVIWVCVGVDELLQPIADSFLACGLVQSWHVRQNSSSNILQVLWSSKETCRHTSATKLWYTLAPRMCPWLPKWLSYCPPLAAKLEQVLNIPLSALSTTGIYQHHCSRTERFARTDLACADTIVVGAHQPDWHQERPRRAR